VRLFYEREGRHLLGARREQVWETHEAVQAGANVRAELQAQAKATGNSCEAR
jgi:hypothetical protein